MKRFPVSGAANSIFKNMNNSVKYLMLCVSAIFILSGSIIAQVVANKDDMQIDVKMQKEIIDSVTTNLNEKYVFPDVAKEMEKYIRKQYKDKAYKDITSLSKFSQKLTEDLREVCKDKHLGIQYVSDEELDRLAGDTITPDVIAELLAEEAYDNFGFKKVERLTGNVGYLKFNSFSGYPEAGDAAIAALNFLANSDALIIDLRDNGGGSPNMIQLISSYFFDEPVHLNSFYLRPEDTIKQFWTQNHVVGKRMSDIPIYVLTSNYTFSAAEEFTYNLKNLERATIVGETTGGGAHPVDYFYVNNLNLGLKIPTGRAINPITGTNWEGVGIAPHIDVPADQALDAAHLDALKKIKEKTSDERVIENLDWAISTFDAKFNPITVDEQTLKSYAGSYGPRQIRFEDGGLVYQREGRPAFKMIPMTEDTFWFEDIDYFYVNNLNLGLKIPTGRAINPITGTNWEGVGIAPHIDVSADQALDAAHLDALKKIKENTRDERISENLDWAISTFEAKFNPITVEEQTLKSYAGSYGPRQIRFENGGLVYQREGRSAFKMIPMTEDTFWFEDIDYFRIQFVKDTDGKVTELMGLYQGGRTDSNKRDSGK